jgi:hypothetical protein
VSNKCLNAVWDHSASKGSARLILLAMADEANDEGLLTAYRRSYSHLASKANTDPSTVRRAVQQLVALGEVAVLKEGTGREQADYKLTLPGIGESRQDAHPGSAVATASVCKAPTQGAADAHPIIPLLPVPAPSEPDNVAVVFTSWLASTGRSARTVLDDKRRRLITKALDAYPLQDVLDAVRGWDHSAHHRGDNDTGTVYNDLGLLLRDAANVERFRDLARGPRQPGRRVNGQAPARPIDTDRAAPSGRITL